MNRPILLLHGFASTAGIMALMEHHLCRDLGRDVIRVSHSLGGMDLRTSAIGVQRLIDELARRPGFEYADIVGHSMGGLIATHVLKSLDFGRAIRRVVTLGTPHHGTPLARAGVLVFGLVSRAIWQMLPGSDFLKHLRERPVPVGSELISVVGTSDRVVPEHCGLLPQTARQSNERVEGGTHMGLVLDRSSSSLVAERLTYTPPPSCG